MVNNPSFAILVLSCDKYSDLWTGFFSCFFKNVPLGLESQIYLGSNTKACSIAGVSTILSGGDEGWSDSYIKILNKIPEDYLLVFLEDIFISSALNRKYFEDVLHFALEKQVNYIRFLPNPKPDRHTCHPLIGEIAPGAPYRATVCGLWNRQSLLSLLQPGESPWDFEIFGSRRSSYQPKYYSTRVPLFKYKNLVEKGFWIHSSIRWARSEGISLNECAHLYPSPIQIGLSWLKIIYFNAVRLLPWQYRVRIVNVMRKILISY